MISGFEKLHCENLSYLQLEQKIRERGLTEYVVESVKGICERVGYHVAERTFEGLALEAVFASQLEKAGINVKHNDQPSRYWYDYEFPDHGLYMDVKTLSHRASQDKWLSIWNDVLNPGKPLFHLRHNGELDKLYILFINTYQIPERRNPDSTDPLLRICPSWIVKADAFFENLKVSKTPKMSYFSHTDCTPGVDYVKFNF